MDKLKRQLAEAEAALEARKKPPEDSGPRIVGEGLVIDEWVRSHYSVVLNDSAQSFTNASHVVVPHVLTISYFLIFLYFRRNEGRDTLLVSRSKWLIQCRHGAVNPANHWLLEHTIL
jgi:hypothetical protein